MVKETVEILIAKREFFAEKVTRGIDAFQGDAIDSEKWSAGELTERMNALQSDFEKFEAKHIQLKCEKALTPEMQDEYIKVEASVIAMKGKMRSRVEQLSSCEAMKSNEMQKSIDAEAKVSTTEKSPIEFEFFEKFTGDQSEWDEFKSKFIEKVHERSDVSAEQKLDVLMRSCAVEMASILSIEPNYSEAWSKLNRMFDNAYNQALYAIRAIQSLPKMQQASGGQICSLVRTVNKIAKILQKRDIFSTFDKAIALSVIAKLDGETRNNWHRHQTVLAESWAQVDEASSVPRNACDYMPDWESVKMFLSSEAEIFGKQSMQSKIENTKAIVAHAEQNNASHDGQGVLRQSNEAYVTSIQALAEAKKFQPEFLQCNLCDGIHPKYKCEVFIGMSFQERWNHVRRFALCAKCLRSDHAGPCAQKTCNQACPACLPSQLFHNSFLCSVKWPAATGESANEASNVSTNRTHWNANEPWTEQ